MELKKFEKILPNDIPQDVRKVCEHLLVKEGVDGENTELTMYFPAAEDPVTKVFKFVIIPESKFGSLTIVTQDIMRFIFSDKATDIIPTEDMQAVISACTVGAGELTSKVQEESKDHADKIFYHLMNGQVLVSDTKEFDWSENIKNMHRISFAEDRIRQLIMLLVTQEEIDVMPPRSEDDTDETPRTPVKRKTVDVAKDEIALFQEQYQINPDYSIFENDRTTEREILIMKLIDMIEVHQQLLSATVLINTQSQIIAYYEDQFRKIREAAEPAPDTPAIEEVTDQLADAIEE